MKRRCCPDGRAWLNPVEGAGLLDAYKIPDVPAILVRDPDEAVRLATPFLNNGTPVVVKILSPDIVHKSEVGGVRLNLERRKPSITPRQNSGSCARGSP